MTDVKLVVLPKLSQKTAPEVVEMLEEALKQAKEGNVTFAILAYGIVGEESPVMQHRGTTGSIQYAKDALLACTAIHLGLCQKHLVVK